MKKYLLLFFALITFFGYSQEVKINWLNFNEAIELQEKQPKHLFIDFYTTWCPPCKKFEDEVLSNPDIIKFMNQNFYTVKFNAEGNDTILFNGNTYTNPTFIPNKRINNVHEFSKFLNIIAYPSLVIIDKNYNIKNIIVGYRTKEQLIKELNPYVNKNKNNTKISNSKIIAKNEIIEIKDKFMSNGIYYSGQAIDNVPNGKGKWTSVDGSWYEGEFKNGVENGIGTLRQKDGLRYTGNFTNGLPNGKFKIQQWTLLGAAKDEWTAIYENGKLISSSQTQTGMTDFINGKYNNSESSSNSSNSDCETINIPTYQIQSNGLKSNGVEKYQDYTVKFDDNMSGKIMFFSSNNKWYFDTGSSFKKYSSKENAIRALYIYSKCQQITEKGKE